jgi:CheY-like chemotaxis protein
MSQEYFLKRKQELFSPINQQIMMCDDENDVRLLAANCLERGYEILVQQYGIEGAKALANNLMMMVEIKADR